MAAGMALARSLAELPRRPTHLVCGMLNTKDIAGYLRPLAGHAASLTAVSIPGEANTLPADETARVAASVGLRAGEAGSVTGALAATPADNIGLRHTQANTDVVRLVQNSGRELHVWTVNDPREMSRYIDMGVDNIITDRPATLIDLLTERATLSDGELLLVKLRNWLHH